MTVHYQDPTVTLHHGKALDVVRELPDEAVNCIVTSPPYYNLRDYAADGQYGLEATPAEYVERINGSCSQNCDECWPPTEPSGSISPTPTPDAPTPPQAQPTADPAPT